jgi:iron complex outermembrane receptor protein
MYKHRLKTSAARAALIGSARFGAALISAAGLLAVASAASAQDAALEEVVVTGSRIVRDGYTAPTPVTVATTEQLQRTAPGSIPDGLNQLPQFTGSKGTQNTGNQATNANSGNYLNLRGLGPVRNLVLLDGARIPPTSFDGSVDTNVIPQALVQRVDVVTGGASAAYGSDAISGVINFILDTRYNGIKGKVQAGISGHGDDESYGASIAGGADVLGGRGHVLFSAEHYQRDGLPRNEMRARGDEWWAEVGNGKEATPYRNARPVFYQTGTFGTVFPFAVNNSRNAGNPLAGYHFLPDGTLVPFNPGVTPAGSSNIGIGGDGSPSIGHSLTGSQRTDQLFGRFDYELTDNIRAFAQLTFSESRNEFVTIGSGTQTNDFWIYAENPFLPTWAQTALAATPGRRVSGGRIHADQPFKRVNTLNDVYTFLGGFEGTIADYNWKATYAHGDSRVRSSHSGNFEQRRWYAALDAVRGPNGNIVCNITVTNPGLMDDCIPINIFGANSPTAANWAYISQVSQYQVSQQMDIVAGEISGDLFTLPAGPVSFAAGAEYRKQKLEQTSNSDPAVPTSTLGLRANVNPTINKYNSTNVGLASGEFNAKEAFAEFAVPLLADLPFIQSLELNGAARYTDYSTSGGVTTWKIGVSYQPIEELRFRYTRSRDIRAPTLNELYAGEQAARGGFTDDLSGRNDNLLTLRSGNPNLTPEIGDTYAVGVVWQPNYIPGFSASIDYYNIEITDAIQNLDTTEANKECIASNGTSPTCAFIIRPYPFNHVPTSENFPTAVRTTPFNRALEYQHGIDYEVSYGMPMEWLYDGSDARLDLRLVGNYNPSRKSKSSESAAPVQTGNVVTGGSAYPQHRINLQANFADGPFSLSGQVRYIGEMKRTRTPGVFYENPTIEAVTYVDLTATYEFMVSEHKFDAFLTINNLFDKEPPLLPNGQPGQQYPTSQAIYDVVGRYFTTGLRFEF